MFFFVFFLPLQLMQEKARNLCESLEGRVDPFDLDVFNPHVQNHVKRAVQRLQVRYLRNHN